MDNKRWLLILGILLCAFSASAQAPVITQTTPVVNQGATLQFTETLSEAGTWTCAGTDSSGGATTCAGSITSGGLYTAPATVTPQQAFGGRQLLPNNSIFNTRVDGLPLRSDSATLIAGAGSVNFSVQEYSFPINYCNGSTSTQSLVFNATPGNNGTFQIPAYPNARFEHGALDRLDPNVDNHMTCIDTTDGMFQENYQVYPSLTTTGCSITSNVATCNFASDPTHSGFYVGSTFYDGFFTGADTYMNGGPFTVSTENATQITFALTHANASTSTAGKIGTDPVNPDASAGSGIRYAYSTYNLPNAQGGGVDAAGLYLMPLEYRIQELENAIATGGSINHMVRMTLQNGFICNSGLANACYAGQPLGVRYAWPGTADTTAGGGLNPYGAIYRLKASYSCASLSSIAQIICTQLKNYGLILADGGTGWATQMEIAAWPQSILAAFAEVSAAGIAPSNFEVVDPSALERSATSSETTFNREIVTFTRTSDSATASVDVALMGVAVGLPNDVMNIQAGTAAQQLDFFASGGATNTVTWSVSPSITGGSLTSGGLLTPPATIAAVTAYTVTATSVDNGSIARSMTVYIYPTGSIYIRPASTTTAYTDGSGHVWATAHAGDSGDSVGCCGDLSGGSWGALADKQIYYYEDFPGIGGEGSFNFSLANGTYQVTLLYGTDQGVGSDVVTLATQGVIGYSNADINTDAGGTYKPVSYVMNTTVTNGTLQIGVWHGFPPSGTRPTINAIQIDYTGPLVGGGTTIPAGVILRGVVVH